MKIADMPEFLNRQHVLTCSPDDGVYDAVVSMAHKGFGAVAVTEPGMLKLLGIFTERDLLTRVAGQGRDIENTKIKDVMSKNVETARMNDSIVLCMGRMDHGNFRHMPVVDESNNLIGMLSQRDFISYTMRDLKEKP